MSKHTPGPWESRKGEAHDVVEEKGGRLVCFIASSNPNGNADRYLIAAAPELLEALQAAMRFIDAHVADPDMTRDMRDAWAELERIGPHEVIAKATQP